MNHIRAVVNSKVKPASTGTSPAVYDGIMQLDDKDLADVINNLEFVRSWLLKDLEHSCLVHVGIPSSEQAKDIVPKISAMLNTGEALYATRWPSFSSTAISKGSSNFSFHFPMATLPFLTKNYSMYLYVINAVMI